MDPVLTFLQNADHVEEAQSRQLHRPLVPFPQDVERGGPLEDGLAVPVAQVTARNLHGVNRFWETLRLSEWCD
jgi:hypothetical protein